MKYGLIILGLAVSILMVAIGLVIFALGVFVGTNTNQHKNTVNTTMLLCTDVDDARDFTSRVNITYITDEFVVVKNGVVVVYDNMSSDRQEIDLNNLTCVYKYDSFTSEQYEAMKGYQKYN